MKQTEAQRLADLMDAMDYEDTIASAAELRIQHKRITALEAALKEMADFHYTSSQYQNMARAALEKHGD